MEGYNGALQWNITYYDGAQTFTMEHFGKIVNGFYLIVTSYIIDVYIVLNTLLLRLNISC